MKIAVASCTKLQQTNPQPVWREIDAEQPDVLLLLGDNVYLDNDHHSDPDRLRQELRGLYAAQLAEPNFAALRASLQARNAPILAIYDDHDFLGNNRYGGENNPALREVAREQLIEAFAPPRTGDDVYCKVSKGNVDILVLDERFYRQSPEISRGDRDAILGGKQWSWFEQQVAASSVEDRFLLVASSTTLHTFGDESWEQYPGAFDRMRTLLKGRAGTMVVSGDVHRNALYDESGVIEVVSSAVARNGIVFGTPRRNFGLLTYGPDSVRIDLRSLKAGWRFDVTLSKREWHL